MNKKQIIVTVVVAVLLVTGLFFYNANVIDNTSCEETYPNGECLPEGMCISSTDAPVPCSSLPRICC